MNQAVSYWSSIPHPPNFPGLDNRSGYVTVCGLFDVECRWVLHLWCEWVTVVLWVCWVVVSVGQRIVSLDDG